jgi:outer membrane immunogenic protein
MKTHLTAALTTLLMLGGVAAASDLPASKLLPPAPPLPAFYNWSGAYLGLQAGYSWGQDRLKDLATASGAPLGLEFAYGADTAVAGAQAGFNYQLGSVVLGVEGDIEAADGRGGFNDPGGRNPFDPGRVVRVKRDWQASLRGRIGFAFDRFMIFGTGGVSFTEFDYHHYNPVARLGEGGTVSRSGWTAGGGVNYAMTDSLILGVDYRYTGYGRSGFVARSAFPGLIVEHSPTMHTLRASLAYKF